MALPAQGSVTDSRLGRIRGSRRSNANSACEGKESNMKSKDKTTGTLELQANTVPSHRDRISTHSAPNHDEVKRRAYEIYLERGGLPDRKSTRLNSSHQIISYAVFCLKKKKKDKQQTHIT